MASPQPPRQSHGLGDMYSRRHHHHMHLRVCGTTSLPSECTHRSARLARRPAGAAAAERMERLGMRGQRKTVSAAKQDCPDEADPKPAALCCRARLPQRRRDLARHSRLSMHVCTRPGSSQPASTERLVLTLRKRRDWRKHAKRSMHSTLCGAHPAGWSPAPRSRIRT